MKNTLSQYLSPECMERIICLDEVESTNTHLKNLADSAAHGTAVIARCQNGGRGRVGRSFASPEGGVYLSLLFRTDAAPTHITAGAAVAVRRAIKRVCGLEVGIKWVNDLILGGKKVCGILTEMQGDAIIVGVGINVTAAPKDVPNGACLWDFGARCSVEELAAAAITEQDALAGGESDFREEYLSACLNIGREVLVIRGESRKIAFAEGLREDFSLLVRYPDGSREALSYGEVSLRTPDGGYI